MTDSMSFPPLRDLPPGHQQARKQHLLAEIAQETVRGRFSPPSVPPLRLRFMLPAAVAICAAAVALVSTGTIGRGTTSTTTNPATHGDHFQIPMTESYNRSDGTLKSIDLTVNPSMANAKIQLEVLHTDAAAPLTGTNPSSNVVFTEVVSATNTTPDTETGSVGPSSWSGTLNPSDWDGGCQSTGFYDIVAYAGGPGANLNGPATRLGEPPVDKNSSGWFSCSGS